MSCRHDGNDSNAACLIKNNLSIRLGTWRLISVDGYKIDSNSSGEQYLIFINDSVLKRSFPLSGNVATNKYNFTSCDTMWKSVDSAGIGNWYPYKVNFNPQDSIFTYYNIETLFPRTYQEYRYKKLW
jgi:hypothetical protein